MRRRLFAAAPVVALGVCLYAVQLPLFVELPGPARDVLPLIDIEGPRTFQPEGRLLLTTVNVGRVNAFDALWAWMDDDAALVPERRIVPPGQTDREFERISLSQMDESKIAAVSVALRRLTRYPREHRGGVIVQDVLRGTPAAGRLFPGDLIKAVDGRRLRDRDHLLRSIREAGTERTLRLKVAPVEDPEEERTVVIRPAEVEDQPVIGIVAVASFPFTVRIESGGIGGPSAGLMWAVGVTDLLTPEDLTEGRTIAGTGSLDLRGRVHPIGGIRLKVVAAERAGAHVFFVPEGNAEEARGAADEIRLVPVRTYGDVVRFLGVDGSAEMES